MSLVRGLRLGILAGIFLVPFIPLLVPDNLFFPFITGKNFTFRIIVEIIFALWLVLMLKDSEARPTRSLLAWGLAAFLVVMGLATLLSENSFKSFWSNYERMEGYVTLLHLGAYFLVAASVFARNKLWEYWVQTNLGVSIILCLYGVGQLLGFWPVHQGATRLDATFGNATYFAVYTVFMTFWAVWLLVRESQLWLRVVYGLIALFNLFILYHTATRGAILGLIGGVLLATLLIAAFERTRPQVRKIAAGLLVCVLLLIAAFFALKDQDFIKTNNVLGRFAAISLEEQTTKSRFIIWDMAWQGFTERPLLGWGQESFNYVFNKYYDPRMYTQEQWFDRTHNVFFDWLIAGGALGLLTYLSLFAGALWIIWKRLTDTTEKAVLTGLLAAYFVHNLFVFDNLISYMLFFSFLAFLHTRSSSATSAAQASQSPNISPAAGSLPSSVQVPAAVVGVLVIVAAGYFLNVPALRANMNLINAIRPQATPQDNLNYFKSALSPETAGTQEVLEQLMQVTAGVANNTQAPSEIKQQFLELTKEEMKKQLARTPNDARLLVFYGSTLGQYGQLEEGAQYLEQAVANSPKKQTILFELGANYLNRGQFDKALEIFKQAHEVEPAYDDARLNYATAAIYDRKPDIAAQVLSEKYGTDLVADGRILRAYADTNQWPKAIAILQDQVSKSPSDTTARKQLAVAYYQSGNTPAAVATLRSIEDIDPSQKEELEGIIKQIQAGKVQ